MTDRTAVYVLGLQVREPFFDHFEIECWDADRVELLERINVRGAYGEGLDLWVQNEIAFFDGLDVGATYWIRARVVTAGGLFSVWSEWAAAKVPGDVGGGSEPTPTYTAIGTVFSRGRVRITFTPVPDPPSADFDQYEIYSTLVGPAAPAADTTPTATIAAPPFDVSLPRGRTVYVWIRARDVSGNRQAWTSLDGGTGFEQP